MAHRPHAHRRARGTHHTGWAEGAGPHCAHRAWAGGALIALKAMVLGPRAHGVHGGPGRKGAMSQLWGDKGGAIEEGWGRRGWREKWRWLLLLLLFRR